MDKYLTSINHPFFMNFNNFSFSQKQTDIFSSKNLTFGGLAFASSYAFYKGFDNEKFNLKSVFLTNSQSFVNNFKTQSFKTNIFKTIQKFSEEIGSEAEHGHSHGPGGCGCQRVVGNPLNITGHFAGFSEQTHKRWVITPRMHTIEENEIKKPFCVLKRVLGEEMMMDFKAFMNEEVLMKDTEEKMTTLRQKLFTNMKFWMELEQFLKIKFGTRYIDHLLENHTKFKLNQQYKSLANIVTFVNKLRLEARAARTATSGANYYKA